MLIRVLNMSLTAGYCILAVLAVRLLLRRAPKKYSYLLWLVVAFRLCCPVSLSSPGSLFNLSLFDREVAGSYTMDYLEPHVDMQAEPRLNTGLTVSSRQSGADSFGNSTSLSPTLSAQAQADREPYPLQIPLPRGEVNNSVNPLQIWVAAGTLLWLTVAGLLILGMSVSYLRLRRRLGNAVLLRENIYQSERAVSPFILGFWRPRIYVPYNLEGQTLELVLAHERYHLRRRDHWIKLFACLLLSLHWFNPLCWAAFLLMSRDMEMSCDEHVLGEIQHCSKPYCSALLDFAVGRHRLSPSPLAFGESGAKGRICNVLRWKKPGTAVKAVSLCLLTVTACGLNPSAPVPTPERENSGTSLRTENTGELDREDGGTVPGSESPSAPVPAPERENSNTSSGSAPPGEPERENGNASSGSATPGKPEGKNSSTSPGSATSGEPERENSNTSSGSATPGEQEGENGDASPGSATPDVPETGNREPNAEEEEEGFTLLWPLGMTDHTWYEEALAEARAGQRVLEYTDIDFYGVEQVLLEPSWEAEELAVRVECYDLTDTGEAVPVWQSEYVSQRRDKGFLINLSGTGWGIYEKLSGRGREIRISFTHLGAQYLIRGTVPLRGSEQRSVEPGTDRHLQGLIRSVDNRNMVIDEKKLISVGDERWEEWAALWDPEDICGGIAVIDVSTPDLLVPVSEDCRIVILENHWQPEREIDWEELLSYMEECSWHMLWNFTVEDGQITEISEQYLP